MFRFEDPQYLYLLALIPVLVFIRLLMIRKRRNQLRKMGDKTLLKLMMPDVSVWRPLVKFSMLVTALALLAVMLARPQMGTKIKKEKRVGIETVIAMDISNSMRATDVEPSRLERSKMMVERLVDNFKDDKIALLVFAGDAFVQLPITSDYVSAKMFLSSIDPSMMVNQGTDIAYAIKMGTESFTQQKGVGKAIIIITDGEDHEGGAVEAAKEARKKGMFVYVLGVGSTQGAPVPVADGSNEFMHDQTGNTVMSKLNEDMCRQIAKAGGGVYIHVENNSNAQEQLEDALSNLSKKEMETEAYSEYDEQFQAFGILILLLLILEVMLLESKNPLLMRLRLFKRNKKAMLLLLISTLAIPAVHAQNDRQLIKKGNKEYRAGNMANAEVDYRKAQEQNPRNPQAAYNLGNALFAQDKDSAAVEQYERGVKMEVSPRRKAMGYHNMGVVCQKNKLYGEAIEAYKNALRLNPSDNESRYNLELCKHQQKKQQQQQQQNQQNQQKDQNGQNEKKEQEKKEQKQQPKDQNKDQQKQQQPKENQMSKDNAEQLLNAAMQQEKNTQQRMKQAMQKPQQRKLEKNW